MNGYLKQPDTEPSDLAKALAIRSRIAGGQSAYEAIKAVLGKDTAERLWFFIDPDPRRIEP